MLEKIMSYIYTTCVYYMFWKLYISKFRCGSRLNQYLSNLYIINYANNLPIVCVKLSLEKKKTNFLLNRSNTWELNLIKNVQKWSWIRNRKCSFLKNKTKIATSNLDFTLLMIIGIDNVYYININLAMFITFICK